MQKKAKKSILIKQDVISSFNAARLEVRDVYKIVVSLKYVAMAYFSLYRAQEVKTILLLTYLE